MDLHGAASEKDMVNGTDKVSDADNLTEEEITKSRLLQYIETLKDSGEYVWQPANPSGDLTEIIIDRKDTGEDFAANHYVVLVKPYDNVKTAKFIHHWELFWIIMSLM